MADFTGVMMSVGFTCANEVCYSELTSGQELRAAGGDVFVSTRSGAADVG